MSNKLVKLPKQTRPTPFRIELPYTANQVHGHLTILVLEGNRVELCGAVEPKDLALSLLNCGAQRLEQWHAQQGRGSGLVGLDGLPLASEAPQEPA